MKPNIQKVCPQCGAQFECTPIQSRRRKYCSKTCLQRSKYPTTREWYKKNRDYANQKAREWHHAHRDLARAKSRAYYRAHSDEAQIDYQTMRVEEPWRILVRNARARATEKKLPFDLTVAWAKSRWTGKCELTGIDFLVGYRGHGPRARSATIDKIDPALGYLQSNCRIVLQAVNALKADGTDCEMYFVAERLLLLRQTSEPAVRHVPY